MRLPRDLSGTELAQLLVRHYGYSATRTRGTHLTLTLTSEGAEHSVTVPLHHNVRVGTLAGIVADVARFLGVSKQEVRTTLFT